MPPSAVFRKARRSQLGGRYRISAWCACGYEARTSRRLTRPVCLTTMDGAPRAPLTSFSITDILSHRQEVPNANGRAQTAPGQGNNNYDVPTYLASHTFLPRSSLFPSFAACSPYNYPQQAGLLTSGAIEESKEEHKLDETSDTPREKGWFVFR